MRKLQDKFISGYIAIRPLPGSPLYAGDNQKIIDTALNDLDIYIKAGMDSVFLENDCDLPYMKPPLTPKAKSLFLKVAKKVRKNFNGPIGIQVLEADVETALDIAVDTDLDFLRVESFVFAHVGGAGIIEACAGKLLRKRKRLGAEHIKIFADVKKKHCSHSLTSDLDITDEIKQGEFFLADGFIITGKFSGAKPDARDLIKSKKTTGLPIIIGSGMTVENIKTYFPLADGFLIGSTFRKEGKFLEATDPKRVKEFMTVFNQLKNQTKPKNS